MGKSKKNIPIQASVNIFKDITKDDFVTSLCVSTHPLMDSGKKIKKNYFAALEHFVNSCASDGKYTKARLLQYQKLFVGDETTITLTENNIDKTIKAVVGDFLKPWKRERCVILLCDIALIITDKTAVKKASDMIIQYISRRSREKLSKLLEILYNDAVIPQVFAKTQDLVTQFRDNRNFITQQEIRVMVTANMSAGKSTLINAIIGKHLARTLQEACTANLCFLFNKPFEDNHVHLLASPLNLNATYNELASAEKETICSVASFFRAPSHSPTRICLIDTPGVNYALNDIHGELTRKAVTEENYDKLIYVLNAEYLGTDDEIRYLKYISENVPKEKVIFVVNKLDRFNSAEDSIPESIEGVKADLQRIGYENPVICPLSAYFSLLIKKKQHNDTLNKNELDAFDFYVKEFNKPEYDLSVYYDKPVDGMIDNSDELLKMSLKCGLYGLETILYGGQ
jgi:GTP-binding protein EngB required for normal cell division